MQKLGHARTAFTLKTEGDTSQVVSQVALVKDIELSSRHPVRGAIVLAGQSLCCGASTHACHAQNATPNNNIVSP